MTVHISWRSKLNLKEKRRLDYVYSYLVVEGKISCNQDTQAPADEQKIQRIEQYFAKNFHSENDRLQFAMSILSHYAYVSIPEKCFDWIDVKNARQCYLLWSVIKRMPPSNVIKYYAPELFPSPGNPDASAPSEYDKLNLPAQPSNAADCKAYLINFFQIMDLPKQSKIDQIDALKSVWKIANQFNHKIFKHLNQDNVEHSKWFWNYLIDHLGVPCWYLKPVNDSEYLPCARAIFDAWQESTAAKILALDKAYSAFHSKKFKLKPAREKGANIWLGADEMNQLTVIAEKKGISVKLLLKRLINSEFIKNSN